MPLNLPELEVGGLATVTSIERCPEIASGEGSVVTARFLTREVSVIARVEVLAADGRLETIEGTLIHPIWSVDRQDWGPLGELEEGERLLATLPSPHLGRGIEGEGHFARVRSVTVEKRATPVYNIEVHGEHVYQVGVLGVLVHNACGTIGTYRGLRDMIRGSGLQAHHLIEQRFAGVLNQKASQMMSVVVNPGQHQIFTNAWRSVFPYGTNYSKLAPAEVEAAARTIYAKFPQFLDALGL